MKRSWAWSLTLLALACALAVPDVRAAVTTLVGGDEVRFPHAEHAGLFPSCTGCHGGVLAADSTAVPLMHADGEGLYPEPAQCVGCHDGTTEPRVSWDGPRREASNLRFSHAEHAREADLGDPAESCQQCHQQQGRTEFMAVAEARPAPCVACHGHPAPAHLADVSPCRTCHVPVARAVALTAGQIAAFPRPASHDDPAFITNHGPDVATAQARCAVCHARESCARCHVNAPAVSQIAALEPDPRVAQLVAGRAASYPAPASHRAADWPYAHGDDARARIAGCANCHAQPGCRSCHTGELGARAIAQLPDGRGGAPGVQLQGAARQWPTSRHDTVPRAARDTTGRVARGDSVVQVRVHPPDFSRTHGPAAGAGRLSCAGCHETKQFCASCHDGESKRRFHPPNFVARHPADAYSRQTECASCHSREGFCGECHQRSGLQSKGRLDVAYHTAQPLWLIQHSRAARQGLESCTTCHVQRDCMQCHSTIGWGVSPHGPGFDARRMANRNAQTCRACHVGDPLRDRP